MFVACQTKNENRHNEDIRHTDAYVCICMHMSMYVHIYILAYFKDTVKFSKDPVPLQATGCWWKCRNVPVPMPRPREYTWAKAPGRHVVVFARAMDTVNFRKLFFT